MKLAVTDSSAASAAPPDEGEGALMSLVNMRARIEGKHFAFEMHDEWRRPGRDAGAVIEREPRPHLVPLDSWAEKLVCIESMRIIGSPSLCPGEILVEGRWRMAYRFQSIKGCPADAAAT